MAHSAEEAWKIVRESPPDVLLLDISMPYVSGVTFLRQLRREGMDPERVVLMSALPLENLKPLAAKLGVAYMSKPFTEKQLRTAFDDLIEGHARA